MLIDIHVHTSKYSECGIDTPDSMIRAAIQAGLDAIVFSEHNHLWSAEELESLQKQYPNIKLFRGIEVSVSWEEHIVVLGVSDPDLFYPLMPPAELMDNVHQNSGAAILAHPFRWSPAIRPDILKAGFDAVEIFSNSIRSYMVDHILSLHYRDNVPLVASSDGHDISALGLYAIDLKYDVYNEQELAKAIKNGDYSLWAKADRIEKINAEVLSRKNDVLTMVENGASLDEALLEAGLSRNLYYALERELDILYPMMSDLK